jgi:hypothetical protein
VIERGAQWNTQMRTFASDMNENAAGSASPGTTLNDDSSGSAADLSTMHTPPAMYVIWHGAPLKHGTVHRDSTAFGKFPDTNDTASGDAPLMAATTVKL